MPPPSVWGPATWKFMHIFLERMKEDKVSPAIASDVFTLLVKIWMYLPCPDCSFHAMSMRDQLRNFPPPKTRSQLITMLHNFHNVVNRRLRKPFVPFKDLQTLYGGEKLIPAFNHFAQNYYTKGNIRMAIENSQRQMLIREIASWIKKHGEIFFAPPLPPPSTQQELTDDDNDNDVNNDNDGKDVDVNNDNDSKDVISVNDRRGLEQTIDVNNYNQRRPPKLPMAFNS